MSRAVLSRPGRSARGTGLLDGAQDVVRGRELALMVADPRCENSLISVDEKCRGPGNVPGVESYPVPHAIGLDDVAPLVNEHIERQPSVFDVAAYRVSRLGEHANHLDPARLELVAAFCELAKLAAAVRSPRAAVEDEQQPPVRQQIGQRSDAPLLVGQREAGRLRQRRRMHQNSFTSTNSPASTMSTCAGISM